jgi:hypothetical protein
MTAIAPLTGFDLGALIDTGLQAERALEDGWHHADGYWHASALMMCSRRNILWQAGFATDGVPRSGGMNFQLGHAIHERLERWASSYAQLEPRFELVNVEGVDVATGRLLIGQLEEIKLKARNDILFRWEGELVLAEIKSERSDCPICKRGGAAYWRQQDMTRLGLPAPVKESHLVQGTATAMCYEPHYGPIRQARAWYWGKNDYLIDQVPFEVSNPAVREFVRERCLELTRLFEEYTRHGELPGRIDPGDKPNIWQCTPRGQRDIVVPGDEVKGLYCPARSVCFRSNG